MKKLVLIIPPSPWLISETDLPSLGVLYLSAFLKQHGYEVDVCDLNGLSESQWKIPIGDVYGVTGSSPNFVSMKKIIQRLKDREPNKTVVAGGFHVTALPFHLLQNTVVDACIIGEGEYSLLEIMRDVPFSEIKGLTYRSKNGFSQTDKRPLIPDLDKLPLPDRDAIDFYKYAKSQIWNFLMGDVLEATIFSSRGCPFQCAFCAGNKMWHRRVRYHGVDRIIKEIKHLRAAYGVELFQYLDDTFVLSKKRLIAICEAMKPLDIKWHCLNRVDMATNYDILKLMKDSGCIHQLFGFESGSDKVLKMLNKRVTVEQACNTIKLVKSLGFIIRGQLIVGLPGETDETVEATAKFIRDNNRYDITWGLHVFKPYPGSPIWENAEYYEKEYGYYVNKDTDFTDYHFIGKPDAILTDDKQVWDWYLYLKGIIGNQSIELRKN